MGSEPGAQGPFLFSFRSFLAAVGRTFIAIAGLSPAAAVFLSGRPSQAEEDFGRDIRPILKARCFGCHGSQTQKGKLNLERYLELSEVVADLKTWQTVAEKVSDGSMPPRGKPPLDDPERARIAHFYEALVRQAEA